MLSNSPIKASFLNNPMYPFSVSAVTVMSICLFQPDRRWAVGRLQSGPRDVCVSDFTTRSLRLSACMKYQIGIGFVIIRQSGLQKRLDKLDFRAIEGGSSAVEYFNSSTCTVSLMPGNYVLVPYTDQSLSETLDYVFSCHYQPDKVEFEIAELFDQSVSKGLLGKKDKKIKVVEEQNKTSSVPTVGSKEGQILPDKPVKAEKAASPVSGATVAPPSIIRVPEWEWWEDSEDQGMTALYDQISDLAEYVRILREDVRRIDAYQSLRK